MKRTYVFNTLAGMLGASSEKGLGEPMQLSYYLASISVEDGFDLCPSYMPFSFS